MVEGSGPDIRESVLSLISGISENTDAVILISDRVIAESREHGASKPVLAWELREHALTHRGIIYIIAVTQQGVVVPHLIDNTINEDAEEEVICRNLVKAFRSIIYRCPPTRSVMDPAIAAQVKMVNSFDEFKESLGYDIGSTSCSDMATML